MNDFNEYLDTCDLSQLVEVRVAIDERVKTLLEAHERSLAETKLRLGLVATSKRERSTKGTTIAAKYRNPKDSSQTWSGRGLAPKWITDSGKKKEYFLIENIQKRTKQKEDSNAGADTYAE